jgi:DNA-binding MarR family transcriptional regulator
MFDDDPRWGSDPRERDDDARDRDPGDPRDVFVNKLDLPRRLERELVRDRDREYTLRGSESRTLSLVGVFRVIPARDLQDHDGRPCDPRKGDLRHLREQGLIRTVPVPGHRHGVVVLTERGRDLLESHRKERSGSRGREDRDRGGNDDDWRQRFYAELKKAREVEHDSQIYHAYEREAQRLEERGARVERIALDYELKREYQQFLQERNRGRADSDGRPDRDESEIREWACEHDLPYSDGHVQFPDARVEYVDSDGRLDHLDVEVITLHYRGAHGAAANRSGFSTFRGASARTGGSPFDPDYPEELLR